MGRKILPLSILLVASLCMMLCVGLCWQQPVIVEHARAEVPGPVIEPIDVVHHANTYRVIAFHLSDGDSGEVMLDLGFEVTILVPWRFNQFDAPERGQDNYKEVTAKLRSLMEAAQGGHTLYFQCDGRVEKWRRWLGDFYDGDQSIQEQMMK